MIYHDLQSLPLFSFYNYAWAMDIVSMKNTKCTGTNEPIKSLRDFPHQSLSLPSSSHHLFYLHRHVSVEI